MVKLNDIDYIQEELAGQSVYNECIVVYGDSCNKIDNNGYYIDDNGILVLKRLNKWNDTGMGVNELSNLLEYMKDKIKGIVFETNNSSNNSDSSNNKYPVINIYESSMYSTFGSYTTVILVGNRDSNSTDTYKRHRIDDIENNSDKLYTTIINRTFNIKNRR